MRNYARCHQLMCQVLPTGGESCAVHRWADINRSTKYLHSSNTDRVYLKRTFINKHEINWNRESVVPLLLLFTKL